MNLTVQEALKNIDIVVSNAKMDRKEHLSLIDSVVLVEQRCNLADELAKEKAERIAQEKE